MSTPRERLAKFRQMIHTAVEELEKDKEESTMSESAPEVVPAEESSEAQTVETPVISNEPAEESNSPAETVSVSEESGSNSDSGVSEE